MVQTYRCYPPVKGSQCLNGWVASHEKFANTQISGIWAHDDLCNMNTNVERRVQYIIFGMSYCKTIKQVVDPIPIHMLY